MNILIILLASSMIHSTELKSRPLAHRANECQLCHIKREQRVVFNRNKYATNREHKNIEISHGNQKKVCDDCHDVNNSNRLFLPATFANTSPVCARCHNERYVEWQKGFHGKKVTGWNNGTTYHCIDCHSPHAVSFKKMQSKEAPKFRNLE